MAKVVGEPALICSIVVFYLVKGAVATTRKGTAGLEGAFSLPTPTTTPEAVPLCPTVFTA